MRANWRPTKPTLFAILMVLAGGTSLLPPRWTGCGKSLTQPMSPMTWLLSSTVHQVRDTADNLADAALSPEQQRQVVTLNQQLELQLQQQSVLIDELEQIIRDLSGLRDQLSDDRARIIFAAVIGGETSPKREMLRISRGARQGIRVGDWVTAGLPPEDRDTSGGGRELLMRQWLIGVVTQVYPYVSDVQLTTDPGFHPGNVFWAAKSVPGKDTTWSIARRECSLEGIGHGLMRVDRAAQDYKSEGYTYILAPLAYPQPIALAVGEITNVHPLETGLHYQFEVKPWGDARSLSYVYVISTIEQGSE